MNTRRITLALGAAGGGLLVAAYLPMAIAQADPADAAAAVAGPSPTDSFSFVPSGPEQITSISGIAPFDQQSSGYQLVDINDTTLGTSTAPVTVGTVSTLENSSLMDSGFANSESLVTGVTLNYPATDLPASLPVDGQITDVFRYAALPSLFSNTYTELPAATAGGTPTATDTLTLFGVTFPAVQESFLASTAFANPSNLDFGPFLTTGLEPAIAALLTDVGVPSTDIATFTADISALF